MSSSIQQLTVSIEENGKVAHLSIPDFEKRFSITFLPRIAFLHDYDRFRFIKKITRMHQKNLIPERSLWLGAYFKNELQSPFIPDVTLRFINASIGWGVFAAKHFKPMSFIGEYSGIVRKRTRSDQMNGYCFEFLLTPDTPTSFTIDPRDHGSIARFINHSAEANVMSELVIVDNLPHIILYTTKCVEIGEQLLFNYGPDYWKKRSPPEILT